MGSLQLQKLLKLQTKGRNLGLINICTTYKTRRFGTRCLWCSPVTKSLMNSPLFRPDRFRRPPIIFGRLSNMSAPMEVTAENITSFLDSVDTILVDCDGVLWNGPDVIPGAPEALSKFRKMGKQVYFMTNNSTKGQSEYVKKCASLGIQASEEEIFGTAFVAAQYIKRKLKYTGKVYMIGGKAMARELDLAGIRHNPPGPDLLHGDVKEWAEWKLDPEVKCVLVAFDSDISYMKLMRAVRYLREVEGCLYIATNTDSALPMGDGICVPGTGTMVNAVSTGAGRQPDVICGKPHPPIFDCLQRLHSHVDPARTVMIGDRLNTDIMLGHNCGLQTLLVLTGYATLDSVRQKQASNSIEDQKQIPNYYIQSLGTIAKLLSG